MNRYVFKGIFCSFNLHFCYYRLSGGSFLIYWTFGFPFLLNNCSGIFAHLSILFFLYFLLIFRNSLNIFGKRPLMYMLQMYFPSMSVLSFSLWCFLKKEVLNYNGDEHQYLQLKPCFKNFFPTLSLCCKLHILFSGSF